jgi:sterol desaturase/sphingolipid hydroxylase (fatty acid hydroxylase superfamily)
MDDLQYGKRNKRGDWAPHDKLEIAPFYALPPNLIAVIKWLPAYLLPWNLLFALTAFVWLKWIVPPVETAKVITWDWVLWLYVVNAAGIFLFYGAFELRLYAQRGQANRFKYNGKWPSENPSDVFWFKSQRLDNFLRCFLIGVPVWTAVHVILLWANANGYFPQVSFADHPVYLLVLAFLVPIIHEGYFYVIHRTIHTPFLYKWVHSVHHNSVNPSPWSSLSMHPVEVTIYFGVALLHLIIPSNLFLALYQLHFAGFGAVVGHIGFDKLEIANGTTVDSHAYAHYLHHKHFEVNYGDGTVPFDKLFGTWHDGTAESDRQMQARYDAKVARINASPK